MKVGVIYNPQARFNKKAETWLSFWQSLDVDLTVLNDPDDLTKAVLTFTSKKYDLVFVSGGDGTVQHLQTEFGNLKDTSNLPILCLLPHGTTNMTASDVGLKSPTQNTIKTIIDRKDYLKRATHIKERSTIKVENVRDTRPQFGVFFGAGALYEAVNKFHQDKAGQKLTGHLATGKILFTEIINAIKNRDPDEEAIYKGYDLSATIDSQNVIDGPQLFLLIATLDKLILGSRPFWNTQDGGLKITSASWPLKKNILSAVYDIMFSHDHSSLKKPDFTSLSCDALELSITDGCFTMDGELFKTQQDKPLKVSLGPQFQYLCG